MLAEVLPPPVAPVAVDEVKAFLRLETAAEDAVIAGFVRAASGLAEAFTGQWLIARDFTEALASGPAWHRLGVAPVVAITGARDAAGPLPGGSYETDIDRHGAGWVRLRRGDAAGRVTVSGRAGLAADWNGVPEAVRLGVIRMAAHLFAHRDDPQASALPGAVSALWRPWRGVGV